MKGTSTTAKMLAGLSLLSIGTLLLTFQKIPTNISSIQDILSSPESFRGELVQLNGYLIKSASKFETLHFLIDDSGRIALKSIGPDLDLDLFVGLRVSIVGGVNLTTDVFGSQKKF